MLNRQVRPQSARQRQGFTLTELLVTIVIIAILIAILLPTVAAIRRSAYAAETRNTIAQISSAIQRYYQDHNAYPGVFANRDHTPSGNRWYVNYNPNRVVSGVPRPGGPVQGSNPGGLYGHPITSSENLVLSLIGGLYMDSGTRTFEMTRVLEGRGPSSLNPNRPKQYTAYIPATDKILSTGLLSEMNIVDMEDSIVPEFIDAWPEGDQLPILYMRANAGARGIITDGADPADQYQYDLRYLEPYLRPVDGLSGLGGFTSGDVVDDKPKANAIQYFRHPTIGGNTNPDGVPVEKDRYILIAAGPDRIFGTKDDIRSWGD